VGYYGTNTAEIAKKAGVSTGIVYGYFQDKRDILISVMEIYIEKAFEPVLKLFDRLQAPLNFKEVVPLILDAAIKTHKKNAKMHEALHSLTHTDEAVSMEFITLEDNITVQIAEKFNNLGIEMENSMEKIHLAMDVIQSFSHEYVFDKHEYIDYDVMREMVTNMIISLFN
jgi:AcrR family transcriptional regulator